MPEVTHRIGVHAPLVTTWAFVKDIEHWAALMPGYRGMTVDNATDSVWRVQGDVGILSKLATLDVRVTEWVERDHVAFTLKGREEPLAANGELRLAAEDPATTLLAFFLAAEAGGMLDRKSTRL